MRACICLRALADWALWPGNNRCHLDLLLYGYFAWTRSPSIVWLCREIKISRGIHNTNKSTSEDYAHSVRHGKQVVDFLGEKSSAKELRLAGNNSSKNATSFIIKTQCFGMQFSQCLCDTILRGWTRKKSPEAWWIWCRHTHTRARALGFCRIDRLFFAAHVSRARKCSALVQRSWWRANRRTLFWQ